MAVYWMSSNGSYVAADGTTVGSGVGVQTIVWDGTTSYTPPSGLNTPVAYTGQSVYQVSTPQPNVLQSLARTVTGISGTVASISVLSLSVVAPVTFTVPGVQLGNFVHPSWNSAPVAGLTLVGAAPSAANTVLVTFATNGSLTLGSTVVTLNFTWLG